MLASISGAAALYVLVLILAYSNLVNCRARNGQPAEAITDARSNTPIDPEVDASPEEIIVRWGYKWKKYDVVTEDGYILSLYRIPNPGRGRPVVFLQHGLECSCTNWITNLPNQSAAFIFADAGFDVWMGNFRGNTYSRRHTTLTPEQHEYWQFSWDEMAKYDLPAMINTTLNVTGASTIYYAGHSMGTLTAFVQLSRDPRFAKKVKKMYAMAPVYTINHIKGVFRWMAPFLGSLQTTFALFGVDQFLPHSWLLDFLAKHFCGHPVSEAVCTNILFLFGGPDSNQMNQTRLPVYLTHSPAGTSTRNMAHFGQMYHSGRCQMYDYGSVRENRLHYNQDSPPACDLSGVVTPISLTWGGRDWLATPDDVRALLPKLRNVLFGNRYLEDFNHLDFIWGLRAAREVYIPIREDIKKDFIRSAKVHRRQINL